MTGIHFGRIREIRMARASAVLCALALAVVCVGRLLPEPSAPAADPTMPVTDKLNKTIENVSRTGPDGKAVQLKDVQGKKATVVVFLSFDCPVSNSYATTLAGLHAAFADKGVGFVGVVPSDDPPAAVAK